jgi:hypothetical protein
MSYSKSCVKETIGWDFLSKVISQKVPNRSSDSWFKAVLNIDSNCREIRLLRSFWAMGHCGKICYALWATASDLVLHYGPLRGMKPYSENLYWFLLYGPLRKIWFCTMGHSTGFGYPLWAIAKDLVKRYGPWRNIWLCVMGHSAKPITIAQN